MENSKKGMCEEQGKRRKVVVLSVSDEPNRKGDKYSRRIENDFFIGGLSEIIVRQQKEIDRLIEEIEIYKKLP